MLARLGGLSCRHTNEALEWLVRKSYFSQMKKASITEAKNNLSKLIDGLASGSSVLIVDRGRPVARLEPVTSGVAPDNERLARLIRAGIVRARSGKPARSVLSSPPPQAKGGSSALAALLDERREGR
jgi:prevent-host-death family protein